MAEPKDLLSVKLAQTNQDNKGSARVDAERSWPSADSLS